MKIVGPDLVAYSLRRDEPRGTIGIPIRDHMNAATVISIVTSALAPDSEWGSVDFNLIQGSILTTQRNELIQRMRGDWLLFIDDDMAWQPGQISKLIKTRDELDLDMVGALCFRRSPPFQPTLYMREQPTSGAYNFLEKWDQGSVVEVDATGMAFILIHRRVFERMVAVFEDKPGWVLPPYEERKNDKPPNFFRWEGQLGEDLRFCQDAKTCGIRIFVDTSIEISHMSEISVGSREFLYELAQRDDELIRVRRELNDRMGLPTVEREEAWQKLGLKP